jgi:hypothetical protein
MPIQGKYFIYGLRGVSHQAHSIQNVKVGLPTAYLWRHCGHDSFTFCYECGGLGSHVFLALQVYVKAMIKFVCCFAPGHRRINAREGWNV